MRVALPFVAAVAIQLLQEQPAPAQYPTVRKSVAVELVTDKKKPYIEHFEDVPFVTNNKVCLFPGENFGVDVTVNGKAVVVTYNPRHKKADVEFWFRQQKASNNNRQFMILEVESRLSRMLTFNAALIFPEQKRDYDTHIFHVNPKEQNFYSWPRPTVKLTLEDFRF